MLLQNKGPTLQLAARISLSVKKNKTKKIHGPELFKLEYTTPVAKHRSVKGCEHHIVGLLFSWREWCTLQNQLHHGEGKRCGYIKAGSQDISSDVKSLGTNGRSQWTMTSLTTIVTQMFQNGLKTTCQDQVLNWPWPWMCMQRRLQRWWQSGREDKAKIPVTLFNQTHCSNFHGLRLSRLVWKILSG